MAALAFCLAILGAPPWLHADGTRIADESGATVLLRGVNLGGWLLDELWLTGFRPWDLEDDAGVRRKLTERFGAAKAADLLRRYRTSAIGDDDFDLLRSLGVNCVRLPIYYRILESDDAPYSYLPDGWSAIDGAVAAARARDLYVILDLHGAPGGQSSNQCTGQAHRNELWSVTGDQDRTVALWGAIAARYAGEPAVAGYDLLNEPWGNYEDDPAASPDIPTAETLFSLYDRILAAIRAVDARHIAILENRLSDPWEMPRPAGRGWTNVVYEFHHYCRTCPDAAAHRSMVDDRTARYSALSRDRNVPIYVGEFFPASPEGFDYYLRQYGENGWSWTNWTYKCWGSAAPDRYWGYLFRTVGSPEVQIATDSLVSIEAKLANYGLAGYARNEDTISVVSRHAGTRPGPGARVRLFAESFSAPDGWAPDAAGKIRFFPSGGAGEIRSGQLRLSPLDGDWAGAYIAPLARPEAVARFDVGADAPTLLSVDLDGFDVARSSAGSGDYESEIKMGIFRDPVGSDPWGPPTEGIHLIIDYDRETSGLLLRVYQKQSAKNNGAQLNPNAIVQFRAGATVSLEVGERTCAVSYAGKQVWSGYHSLHPESWAGGGFAALGAQHYATQRIAAATFDNFVVRHGATSPAVEFADAFSGVAGMTLRAAPDSWAMSVDGTAVFAAAGARLIPPDRDGGAVSLRPMAEYWKGVAFDPAGDPLRIEVKVASILARKTGAGPEGAVRIAVLPEAWGAGVLDHAGPALFVEARADPAASPATFEVAAFRKEPGSAAPVPLGSAPVAALAGSVLGVSVGGAAISVDRDGLTVLRADHGLDLARALPDGAWPLVEVANGAGGARIEATIAGVDIRHRPEARPFVRGDASADGAVDIGDAISVLAGLFFAGPIPCREAADENDDGQMDISDAIAILGVLFLGDPPQPPYPACGADPTADALGCEGYPPCGG